MPIQHTEMFFNVQVVGADGKVTDHLYKTKNQAVALEQQATKEKGSLRVTKAQAFTVTTAESMADIANVIKDPEVQLFLWNYGVKLYQQNLRSRHMKDPEWEATEGEWDLIQELQNVKAERRSRAPKQNEFARLTTQFKKLYAKRHPEAAVPSDEQINNLLTEIFNKQAAAQPPQQESSQFA